MNGINRYLRTYDVSVNSSMRFDNIQTIKEAVMLGSGVSLVPRRILRAEVAEGRIAAIPMAPPGLSRPLGILHRKRKRFSRSAQAFLELLQEAPGSGAESPARALRQLACNLLFHGAGLKSLAS